MGRITVDFSRPTGLIKPMHGVNNGPIPRDAFRGLGNYDSFREAGIPYIRTHDSSFLSAYGGEHTIDVGSIFRDFDADENDPASYDFTLTDYYLLSNVGAGAKILYRLGAKIEHEPKKYQTVPPKDFAKWARICEHIIRHLVYGWAEGPCLDIRYWEIWNEPDCYDAEGNNPCWQGTFEQFLELYEVASRHLKCCFPELKIGGPALTRSYPGYAYFERFVSFAAERGLPMDFYSWHRYTTDPRRYAQDAAAVRQVLDRLGYTRTELILNEWNYVSSWVGQAHKQSLHTIVSEKGAAFDAASMLSAQNSPLDLFMYYDARGYCEFNGLWSAFTFEPLKGYYAFWQFNQLYRLGTQVFSESDDPDVYTAAAKDTEGAGIQLAYYRDDKLPETTVEIALKGMTGKTEVTCYLVDATHDNEAVRRDVFSGKEGSVFLKLQENSVVYLCLRAI